MIARLKEAINDSDALGKEKRADLRGVISTKPGLNRCLRVTPAACSGPGNPSRNQPTSGNTRSGYTPSTQDEAYSRTSEPRFTDHRALQLRNPGGG
jgi:hypothetical protein